ncbi:MAG: aldo/keto reductase [Candidatus Limnocylindrales bacterium]|jgi:aryl-alcohol dehydrogenase-like predicted oxidoreductase
MKRTLGRSGIEVSAVGMGCWAIGGPWAMMGAQAGWGIVDDAESTRAIHAALELGANLFDTAANYGAGHSERVLGAALKGRRDQAVIATKFGYDVDESARTVIPYGSSEAESDVAGHVRENLEGSLRRLDTDHVDIYLLHVWGLTLDRALAVRDVLEELVAKGKVRTYGWSTDRPDAVEAFSTGPGCGVVEQELNLFTGSAELLALAERLNLASINRAPLGMGMLTGKITPQTRFRDDDIRQKVDWFAGIKDGRANQEWLDSLASIREILTSNGRTLAQGALAWIWGRSPATVPLPGFRTVAQVQENARAMEFGPLTPAQMAEIDRILGR